MQSASGHGLDALGTTPATRLGSGGTTLIAPASAAVQAATTRSSTLLYARPAFLSIPLGSLGTVAVRGKACEGWWNHMSRPPPARPHDSLRRLTLRHNHRAMSTSWVALAVARLPPILVSSAMAAGSAGEGAGSNTELRCHADGRVFKISVSESELELAR